MEKAFKKLLWSAFAVSLIASGGGWSQTDPMSELLQDDLALIQIKDEDPETNKAAPVVHKTVPSTSVEDFLDAPSAEFSEVSDKKSVSDEFLGLESEVLPELKGSQRFTPPGMHESAELNVQEAAVEIDKEPLKGQNFSLIPWASLDPEKWMDIDLWLKERDQKDKTPDWKMRLRDQRQMELVGKVLQCKGTCHVFRGTAAAQVQHLSRIVEGDEFRTGDDSQAWVYLMDGTLVRVSPNTSVSFQEINWSREETFYLVRLNQGHLFWHPRDTSEFVMDTSPETDAINIPLLVREANQQWFERQHFVKGSDENRLGVIHTLDDAPIRDQINRINELRKKNAAYRSSVMLVMPNSTLISSKASFDALHLVGGKSYFKKQHSQEGHLFSLQMRGYSDTSTHPLEDQAWYEAEPNGRSFSKLTDSRGELQILELITKRIKTIELAREIWLEKYTLPVLAALNDNKRLAIDHGYVLWGPEQGDRFAYLFEYTRRIETTNLRSIDNLIAKFEERGEKFRGELSDDQYRAALNHYLMGLKSRYMAKNFQIREMNDLQYYVWILRQGRL